MSIRTKFILYWIFIHLVFAVSIGWLLWENRGWVLVIEALLAVSLGIALYLVNVFLAPVTLVMKGIELIKDSNLSSRLTPLGQPEADTIIFTYNRMLDRLRTERLRIEEKHYFLEKIITASPSGIITLDFDERISLLNPRVERIFEIRQAEWVGKRLSELELPTYQAFGAMLETMEIGTSGVITLSSRRKIRCTKSDFFDQGFPRIFVVIEELTEELRLSEKMAYEKLIRVISHEINNSIGAANSLLHSCMFYKDQLSEDDQEDFETAISVIISRTEHLNAFMRSYANVIRLHEPRRQPCNLLEILEGIAILYKAELAKRNIELRWKVEPEDENMLVSIDRGQMEQVFVNILKNAMEAIKHNGTITIEAGLRQHTPFLIIRDTGSGIPPEVKNNLFTPFFSTKENGQGIGLTMIQEILTRHQFEFSLDSTAGEGTSFMIYFNR